MSIDIDKLTTGEQNHISQVDHLGITSAGVGCIVEVASDRVALVEALAEYCFRMVYEAEGGDWGYELAKIDIEVRSKTRQKIQDEMKSRLGVLGV